MAGTDIYIYYFDGSVLCLIWKLQPNSAWWHYTATNKNTNQNENPIKFSNSNIPNHQTLLLK